MGGKVSTSWKPGQSGNPKGRPKKERALTTMLEKAGAAGTDHEGKRVSGKRLLALRLWELVKTGKTTFSDGKVISIEDADDFMRIAKFLYQHIDGPPPIPLDVEHSGGISVEYVNDWRELD